ncbi:Uncharacterised protein [Raoultella ornithinolytica]|nr:Uncharacterised protein [Raoultella ornithinolytica]
MCTICTITLVSTQKRKNERLLLACRPAGIHSGGGSFSGWTYSYETHS